MRKIIKVGAWIEYDKEFDAFTVHFRDRWDRTAVISTQKITRHFCNGIVGYIHEEVTPKRFKWKWRAKMIRDKKSIELMRECYETR
jgi:hypothetical protein